MKNSFPLLICFLLTLCSFSSISQSVDIPFKHAGISFGNSTQFTGIRFNIIDRNIRSVNGINFSVWQPKNEVIRLVRETIPCKAGDCHPSTGSGQAWEKRPWLPRKLPWCQCFSAVATCWDSGANLISNRVLVKEETATLRSQ